MRMQSAYVLIIIAVYFGVLMLISHLTSRKGSGNDAFSVLTSPLNGM